MIESLQTIVSHSECYDEQPDWSENMVEDYQAKFEDTIVIINLVNAGAFSPQFGSGSPEGVITANYSLKYIDTDIPTEYYNETFESNTGWVAL